MSRDVVKKLEIVLAAMICIYAVFILVRIVGAAAQTAAYPNEYREAANIAMTRAILNGENIYSLEAASGEIPPVCYLYGPLMCVLAAFFSVILPWVKLQVIHYAISIAAILISAFLMAVMVKKYTASPVAPPAVFVLTIFCHWRYGYAYGAPDSFGLCLMIMTLFFLLRGVEKMAEGASASDKAVAPGDGADIQRGADTEQGDGIQRGLDIHQGTEKKHRADKKRGAFSAEKGRPGNKKDAGRKKGWGIDVNIELAALLTLASFFTKQYFLMVAAVGGIYLFIMSTKLFLRYVSSGIAFSIIVFSLLAKFCPLYLTYAIYFLKGPGPGAAMGKTGKAHNLLQVSYLGGMFLMLFVAAFAILVLRGFSLYRIIKSEGIVKAAGRTGKVAGSAGDSAFTVLFFCQAAVSALVLRYIGNNDGAFLSYYLQLFTPALAALSVYGVEYITAGSKKRLPWILLAVYFVFMGYTIYKTEPRLVIARLSEEELGQWERAYELLDRYHDEGSDIYYCPLLNYYGYEAGDYIYNDGQPFVFTGKFLESFENSEPAKKLFPHAGEVINAHLRFREELRQRVIDGDYSLVMRLDDEDMDKVFSTQELKQNYELEETLDLRAGSWTWTVEFWRRKAAG